jgi:hypothetical protein
MATSATRLGGAALAATIALVLSAPPAQAGYVVTLEQVGSDVVATGSGAIDLTGLTFRSLGAAYAEIVPSVTNLSTGPYCPYRMCWSTYTLSGPLNFGGGTSRLLPVAVAETPSTSSGRPTLATFPWHRATSPTAPCRTPRPMTTRLSSSLSVTPGAYEWTWGSGANQNFTLDIGTAVPEA